MKQLILFAAVPMLALAACGDTGAAPSTAAGGAGAGATGAAALSRADERMPHGMAVYVGQSGARDFSIQDSAQGQIATYAVAAKPHDVVAFYEDAAKKLGMTYNGRVDAGDIVNVEMK
ncbi:MAG: hypothetical protein ACKOUM_08425, partial [Sphingopyxis sp.]